jgi:hypothetical protein
MRRIGGTLREDLCTFKIISRLIFIRMRHISDKLVEKIKTNFLCSITFSEKCAIYEIMRNILVQPDMPQMTI